jgi:amidase
MGIRMTLWNRKKSIGALSHVVALSLALAGISPALAQPAPRHPLIEEKSAEELGAQLAAGRTSSIKLTRAYLDRIKALDPMLHSIIAVSPNALDQARASDARRKAGKAIGPLDGIAVLIKDNIETKELPTTVGSLALKDNWTGRDAPVVALIRAQGAVILGKTNLAEWSNFRSTNSMSGWSAIGGLVRNPYALDRTTCSSSSGSGAAVAASLAPLTVGTDTIGSVPCPAAMTGLVGLRPTLGMVSRTHLVPVSPSQDTPGPMARSVKDTALLFNAMVGADPADPATQEADKHRVDFTAGLSKDALKGRRIGYWTPQMSGELSTRFEEALDQLRKAGATLIEVKKPQLDGLFEGVERVLYTEFKTHLAAYLATTPDTVKVRTLADVIAFNDAHKAEEMPFFGQEAFLKAEKTQGLDDPEYLGARAKSRRLAGAEGIDAMLAAGKVEVLVTPTIGVPWLSDPVRGDLFNGFTAIDLPAISGYPHLTVPMGLVGGLPVGLSFIGPAWSDKALIDAGYAYEQQARARRAPLYLPTVKADLGPRTLR